MVWLVQRSFIKAFPNEATHVRKLEAREFARSFAEADVPKYWNCHDTRREQVQVKAVERLKTTV